MSLFRRRSRIQGPVLQARRNKAPADGSQAASQDGLACLTCGQPLGLDPEDEPTGDAGGPICGECNRSRNFDVILEGEPDDR